MLKVSRVLLKAMVERHCLSFFICPFDFFSFFTFSLCKTLTMVIEVPYGLSINIEEFNIVSPQLREILTLLQNADLSNFLTSTTKIFLNALTTFCRTSLFVLTLLLPLFKTRSWSFTPQLSPIL